MFEKDAFSDALSSVRTGMLLFYDTWTKCQHQDRMKEKKAKLDAIRGKLDELLAGTITNVKQGIPKWMVDVAGEEDVLVRYEQQLTGTMPSVKQGIPKWMVDVAGCKEEVLPPAQCPLPAVPCPLPPVPCPLPIAPRPLSLAHYPSPPAHCPCPSQSEQVYNMSHCSTIKMRMPHRGAEWDDATGGNTYGGPPGPLSIDFSSQLQEDCPGCPLWPDPEDVATMGEARKTATELFAFAPPFLIFGYFPRGRLGLPLKEW
eukprot:gene3538-13607_t